MYYQIIETGEIIFYEQPRVHMYDVAGNLGKWWYSSYREGMSVYSTSWDMWGNPAIAEFKGLISIYAIQFNNSRKNSKPGKGNRKLKV